MTQTEVDDPPELARVRAFLARHGTALEPLLFDEPLMTSQQAADALGIELGQVAKSILFRGKDGYGLFVAAGDVRIDTKRVQERLGRKPRTARPDEVQEVTGYAVGAVCPFALATEVAVFVDASLARFDKVYTAAGIPESLLPIRFDDLVAITGATVMKMVNDDQDHVIP